MYHYIFLIEETLIMQTIDKKMSIEARVISRVKLLDTNGYKRIGHNTFFNLMNENCLGVSEQGNIYTIKINSKMDLLKHLVKETKNDWACSQDKEWLLKACKEHLGEDFYKDVTKAYCKDNNLEYVDYFKIDLYSNVMCPVDLTKGTYVTIVDGKTVNIKEVAVHKSSKTGVKDVEVIGDHLDDEIYDYLRNDYIPNLASNYNIAGEKYKLMVIGGMNHHIILASEIKMSNVLNSTIKPKEHAHSLPNSAETIENLRAIIKSLEFSPSNKETPGMQSTAVPMITVDSFAPVTYAVITGFLQLPINVKDAHFKMLLESRTENHALDFLGDSNTMFDQIKAYLDMARDSELVHPSIKALSKVVTFSFCKECLNSYDIIAVEYLNSEYKSLTGVDYDFINIASSLIDGKKALLDDFVKKYKRKPCELAVTPTIKTSTKSKASIAKNSADIYSIDLAANIQRIRNTSNTIKRLHSLATTITPGEFKRSIENLNQELQDKIMTVYRRYI